MNRMSTNIFNTSLPEEQMPQSEAINLNDCDPSESSDESSTLGDQHEGDDSGVLLLRTFGLRSVLGLFVLVSVIVAVVQLMCYNFPSTKPRLRVIKKDDDNADPFDIDEDYSATQNSSRSEPVRKSGSSKSRGSGKNRVSGSSKSQNSVSGKKRAGQVSVLIGGAGMVAGGLGMAASKMLMHEEGSGGENLENIDILEIPPTEEELLMADLNKARVTFADAEQQIVETAALKDIKEAAVVEAKDVLADAKAELKIQKDLVSIAESKAGVRDDDVLKAGEHLGNDNRTIGSQEADRVITGAGSVKTEDVADEDLEKVLAELGEASTEYQALKVEEAAWQAKVVNAQGALDKAEDALKSQEDIHALAVKRADVEEKRLAKAETNYRDAKRELADQLTEERLAAAAANFAETGKDSEGRVIEALDNDANFLGPDDSHDVEYTEESLTQNNVFNVCLVVFLLSFVLLLGGLLLFVLDHFGRTE